MVEKMVEAFTPEMIAIVIVCLTALTIFHSLLALITLTSLLRAKKRLLNMGKIIHEMDEQHEALRETDEVMSYKLTKLLTAVDKIGSIECQLDGFDQKIAENQRQLTGHVSKLNEHDHVLTQVNQMIGKDTGGLAHAIQEIRRCKEEVQNLRTFQCTFEQIRDRILDALGAMSVNMSPRNTPSPEQKVFKEEAVITTEPRKNDLEELHQSRMHYHYP
jgi:hypothetical protein